MIVCRAAEGHHPARRLEQGPRDRRQDHPRHQGAGGLLRRHPADDRQRHVHHQRHRARHRPPAAPLAGRLLPLGRQDALTSRRSSRTAARGWSSSTTARTSLARPHRPQARSSWPPVFLRALGLPRRRRDASRAFYIGRQAAHERRTDPAGRWATASIGLRAWRATFRRSRAPRLTIHGGQEASSAGTPLAKPEASRRRRRSRSTDVPSSSARSRRPTSSTRTTGEVILEANERARRRASSRWRRRRTSTASRSSSRRSDEIGPVLSADAEEGSDPHPRRGADRDLPPPAAGRSADARQLALALREHVLQPAEAYDFSRVGRLQAQHQARAEHAARREDPAPAGLLRGASATCSKLRRTRPTSTTSTTSATAASARSASSSRTSSASAWSAWSARSRKRCRSTRKWRPRCRTT